LFVAFATSVPEAVVTVAALRVGAPNMAFANLLGSNLFNIAILVISFHVLMLMAPILPSFSLGTIVSVYGATFVVGAAAALYLGGRVAKANPDF